MALFLRGQSMFKACVKTSTPVKTMQMLCLVAGWGWALAWAAAAPPQVALAGVDTVSTVRKGLVDAASANATPAEKMQAQVRQWMAQTSGGSADDVQIAPMDSRVQVMPCERALWIDHPFASRETVRVRCPAVAGAAAQNAGALPLWQVYLRILSVGAGVPARVTGSATPGAATKMVVVRQLLQRGTILTPEVLQEVDAPAPVNGQVDASQLTSLQDASMAELVRDLPAGSPVRTHDIRRAVLVKMGQQVMMTVGSGADFQIRVRVEALQDGRMGEQVKLKNTESGRNMSGVVTGPNTVKGL
jgi:flagellar basal body P-ring formation protein FlgA